MSEILDVIVGVFFAAIAVLAAAAGAVFLDDLSGGNFVIQCTTLAPPVRGAVSLIVSLAPAGACALWLESKIIEAFSDGEGITMDVATATFLGFLAWRFLTTAGLA